MVLFYAKSASESPRQVLKGPEALTPEVKATEPPQQIIRSRVLPAWFRPAERLIPFGGSEFGDIHRLGVWRVRGVERAQFCDCWGFAGPLLVEERKPCRHMKEFDREPLVFELAARRSVVRKWKELTEMEQDSVRVATKSGTSPSAKMLALKLAAEGDFEGAAVHLHSLGVLPDKVAVLVNLQLPKAAGRAFTKAERTAVQDALVAELRKLDGAPQGPHIKDHPGNEDQIEAEARVNEPLDVQWLRDKDEFAQARVTGEIHHYPALPELGKGEVLVAKVPSTQTPGVSYSVFADPNGVIWCSCKAWVYSKSTPRTCKHLATLADEGTVPAFFRDLYKEPVIPPQLVAPAEPKPTTPHVPRVPRTPPQAGTPDSVILEGFKLLRRQGWAAIQNESLKKGLPAVLAVFQNNINTFNAKSPKKPYRGVVFYGAAERAPEDPIQLHFWAALPEATWGEVVGLLTSAGIQVWEENGAYWLKPGDASTPVPTVSEPMVRTQPEGEDL